MMPARSRKKVIILGATGSIGKNAVDVIDAHPDLFEVAGLSAHGKADELAYLGKKFKINALCLSGKTVSGFAFCGERGLLDLLRSVEADIVLNAISGRAGLESSFAALASGKDLALANKETMVCAGRLVKKAAKAAGKLILPVDSEHSAVFQLIGAVGKDRVDEIILTASGGPFRDLPLAEFPSITLSDALKHPNWSMGAKITIDSSTMANKGLEVIEARELFELSLDRIKVLIHRESRVHSLVRTTDGSLYAQISLPDMRIPIQNALSHPDMIACPFGRLDLAGERLSFDAPDLTRFPLLEYAYQAAHAAGSYPLAYNAANEIAVQAFLEGRIGFLEIGAIVSACLGKDWSSIAETLEETAAIDMRVRDIARACVKGRKEA
jgi:1-deoxy-D-xylulose-5-phosphate reductoisomerase